MTDVKVGRLAEKHEPRDAIHIAIIPITAAEKLKPGEHVGLTGSKTAFAATQERVGIVDPFLRNPIEKGETFWL